MSSDDSSSPTAGIGVFIYFERIGKAPPNQRWAMARAALALSYPRESAPIDLSTLVARLDWDEYHTVLGMLNLYAHAPLRWNAVHLGQLRAWAKAEPLASES